MINFRCLCHCSTISLITLILLSLSGIALGAESGAGIGVVRGQINYCGKGGVEGMQVYVPGRQFVVVTAADGKFLFDQLPAGEYVLKFKLGERVFKHSSKIYVFKQKVSELGEVAFCGKGVTAGTLSTPLQHPSSSTPAPSPVAPVPQQTHMVRPKAKGCSEGTVVNISNGTAECKDGHLKLLSCSKGHGDCDHKIENGCEVDLMNDNDHCGSCNNACSMLETCTLGSC